MRSRRSTYLRLLSVLVAGAAAAPIAVACGGKAESTSSSSGSSGASGDSTPGKSPTSTPPSPPPTPNTGCYPYDSTTRKVDPTLCEPQVQTVVTCGGSVCSWTTEVPCEGDGGSDPDAGALEAGPGEPACLAICNAARPTGAGRVYNCMELTKDGGAVVISCGGCGVGRPPLGFAAERVRAPSLAAERLAEMAQLEAASIHAFRMLYEDLVRLGAPGAMLRDVLRAADDEARHARDVRREAERLGAVVPEVPAMSGRARSVEQLAIENAEEGCVVETFGAALAAMQAERATDPRIRRMMARVARDELRHAALSWWLAEWLDAKLDARGRARVAEARLRAMESVEREVARAAGIPELGLPDVDGARAVLEALRASLASGLAEAA
jgi:rubrerythrin